MVYDMIRGCASLGIHSRYLKTEWYISQNRTFRT